MMNTAGKQKAFADNWRWQEQQYSLIEKVLLRNAMHLIKIDVASQQDDMQRATDFVVTMRGGAVAVRIRKDTKYRDFTIRAKMASGYKTELDKLRQGFGDFYLYLWTEHGALVEYWLMDLHRLRASGMLDGERNIKWNVDRGSAFIALSLAELQNAGAIMNREVFGGR